MSANPCSQRWQMWLVTGVAVAGLGGCASVNEKVTRWFSSNVEAMAVFDGRVLRGQASFANDRVATLHLESSEIPSLTCLGALRYTATRSGIVDFSCNDGRSIMVPFQSRSLLSGVGRGLTGNAEFALTYGMAPDKAASFLALPMARQTTP